MANINTYPGQFLKATQDHTSDDGKFSVKQNFVVQVLNPGGLISNKFLTFVGVKGTYDASDEGWEVYNG